MSQTNKLIVLNDDGTLSRTQDGDITNIGGSTSPTWLINGKGLIFTDGTSTKDGSQVLIPGSGGGGTGGAAQTLQQTYNLSIPSNNLANIQLAQGKPFSIQSATDTTKGFTVDDTGKSIFTGNTEFDGLVNTINNLRFAATSPSTTALIVDQATGIIPTVDLVSINLGGVPVVEVDLNGNLLVAKNITLLGKINNVDVGALSTLVNSHLASDSSAKHTATQISFNNASTGLSSTNVQNAIIEVKSLVKTSAVNITFDNSTNGMVSTNVQAAITEVNAKNATNIGVTAISGLTATTVQQALVAINNRIQTAAVNITVDPATSNGLTSTNVQSALAELKGDIINTASGVNVTPISGMVSTNVQSALAELNTKFATPGATTADNVSLVPPTGFTSTNVQQGFDDLVAFIKSPTSGLTTDANKINYTDTYNNLNNTVNVQAALDQAGKNIANNSILLPKFYGYTANTASSTWPINHNLGTNIVQITIYDGYPVSGPANQIYADTVTVTDLNNATIKFATPQTGYALVVGYFRLP